MQNKDYLHFVTHLMRLIVTFSCLGSLKGICMQGGLQKHGESFPVFLFSLSLIFRLFMKFVLEKKMLSLI